MRMHPNFYADDCHCSVSAQVKAKGTNQRFASSMLAKFICNQRNVLTPISTAGGGGMVKLAVPLLCTASLDFAEVKSR